MPPASALLRIYEKWYTFADFSLYLINFARNISEAATGGAWGAQRPVLSVKEPKTGVRSARVRAAKAH